MFLPQPFPRRVAALRDKQVWVNRIRWRVSSKQGGPTGRLSQGWRYRASQTDPNQLCSSLLLLVQTACLKATLKLLKVCFCVSICVFICTHNANRRSATCVCACVCELHVHIQTQRLCVIVFLCVSIFPVVTGFRYKSVDVSQKQAEEGVRKPPPTDPCAGGHQNQLTWLLAAC